MPLWRGGRPLKRWRYVGVYSAEMMVCVGEARVGPMPQRWWAVALPGGELHERTTFRRGGVSLGEGRVRVRASAVEIDIDLTERPGVETASPVGPRDGYIWTRKQANVPARGRVAVGGSVHAIDGDAGFIDDSAGYHPRHTEWRWSAGVGRASDGRSVGWNLVTGLHDAEGASERTLWIDGEPDEVGPVRFASDLSELRFADGAVLSFSEWSAREEDTNALLVRSRYRQPFGTFVGTLPGGVELAEGFGVMEDHDVWW